MRWRRSRGERGAVAIMVSVSMIAIFGFVALSVDLGNAWQNRRQLVTATDAGALAAAQEYALNGNGCGSVATNFVSGNKGDATITTCDPSAGALAGASSGDVMISAESTVEYAFAPIFGKNSDVLGSTTIARYGIPLTMGGLRPFGLCQDKLFNLPEYIDWDTGNSPPMYAPYSEPVEIVYSKSSQPADCNGGDPVPGNWATMDFDGGSNSNADIQNWTANGYPGQVSTGPVAGDTGAFSPSLATELQGLIDWGEPFPLPLFTTAMGTGSNAVFEISGFISVRITAFKTSGSQANRSITIQFVETIGTGTCCDASGVDTGTYVVQICAVDPGDRADCAVTP